MKSRTSPLLALLFAGVLLLFGFSIGYGFHTAQSSAQNGSSDSLAGRNGAPNRESSTRSAGEKARLNPPIVKGLHISPDGTRVAFTAVSSGAASGGDQSSRYLVDLKSGAFETRPAPRGWQDFVVQWSDDGQKILFDREKIPRAVAETQAGLYEERVLGNGLKTEKTLSLAPSGTLPPNEKSVSGFWLPSGELAIKTRREPKNLFVIRGGQAQRVDGANVTYFQNRAVRENGRDVFYVVRDVPQKSAQNALFRVENGRARQIGPPLGKITWAYVAENARWLVVCRAHENSADWQWSLYRVTPRGSTLSSTRSVPGDVISVFWSPDLKQILGTSGESLWKIAVPSLQAQRIGARRDWSADDAGWLPQQNAVLVASRGVLWRVDLASGQARAVWKFPLSTWN